MQNERNVQKTIHDMWVGMFQLYPFLLLTHIKYYQRLAGDEHN